MFSGPEVDAAEARAAAEGAFLVGGLQYAAAESPAPGWWGVFRPPEMKTRSELIEWAAFENPLVGWLEPEWTAAQHGRAVTRLREHLAAGDTYQVNLTFGLRGKAVSAQPWSWRHALRLWLELLSPEGDFGSGQGSEGVFAWFGEGQPLVASLSPELFFSLQGNKITTRPMKGTAARGADAERDALNRQALASSAKDRAENLMITDMIRNDLGRLAVPGSVQVPRLFDIEGYPTVWQMTSTVEAQLPGGVRLTDLLKALFPCASITGAPKIRTQHIIGEVETQPRGWYTGTLGWYRPGEAHFNVLIRTLVFPAVGEPMFRLGIGGGVVWDSTASGEYAEALAKARFLGRRQRSFDLLESLLWEPSDGFFLRDRHFARLEQACAAFGVVLRRQEFDAGLEDAVQSAGSQVPLKVRVLVTPEGKLTARAAAVEVLPDELSFALAEQPFDAASLLLRRYKTTDRAVYETRKAAGADQTIYWNEKGELTESSTMNLVLDIDGELLTPAWECGLLAGTFRQQLLEEGRIREAVLPVALLERADAVWLINSVRRWKKGKPFRPTSR